MQFIEQVNNHHPKIKFTAETSITEITFVDTKIYKPTHYLRCSNIQILARLTHREVKKAALKERLSERTLEKKYLKRKLKT